MLLRRPAISSLAPLACGLAGAAPGKAADFHALAKRQPMTFFVAKSACGPGCSEWIAVEGMT
jgi:hypothetical protein